MKTTLGVAATTILAVLLTACSSGLPPKAPGQPLRVIATFSILGDMVRNVGGEQIELTVLAGSGMDTHTYAPIASDAVALAQADVVIENGLEFEPWLDDLYTSSGSRASRVAVSTGVEVIVEGGSRDAQETSASFGVVDPHIWHNVANAIVMVRNISDALAGADPTNAAYYQANADAYIARLAELDEWIVAEVELIPPANRVLVTTHDTFGYFADRYGFQVVGTILPVSTEGASPSAQELASLVQAIQEAGAPAIFADSVASNGLLNQVANEAGVGVVASLFTDALGPAGSAAATYLDMMRFHVATMVEALAG